MSKIIEPSGLPELLLEDIVNTFANLLLHKTKIKIHIILNENSEEDQSEEMAKEN